MKHSLQTQTTYTWLLLVGVLVITIIARLYPHPYNFAPVGALALFAGAMFQNRILAYLAPVLCMFATDSILHLQYLTHFSNWPGYHPLMFTVYAAIAVSVFIGSYLPNIRWQNVLGGALCCALAFFSITNFAHWLVYGNYGWQGLIKSYTDAVPFFRMSILGDLVYSGLFFGSYALIRQYRPKLAGIH